jgi:hypothetical protein
MLSLIVGWVSGLQVKVTVSKNKNDLQKAPSVSLANKPFSSWISGMLFLGVFNIKTIVVQETLPNLFFLDVVVVPEQLVPYLLRDDQIF